MDESAIRGALRDIGVDENQRARVPVTPLDEDIVRTVLAIRHQRRLRQDMRGELLTLEQTQLKHYFEQRAEDMHTMRAMLEGDAADAFSLQYEGDPLVRRRLPVLKGERGAMEEVAARMGRRLAETEGARAVTHDTYSWAQVWSRPWRTMQHMPSARR